MMTSPEPTIETFGALDIRVARITHAEPLASARNPAYALTLDCGPHLGVRTSSAQLTDLYEPEDLIDKLVLAVVNLPPRRVAGFKSECLVLGVYNSNGTGEPAGPVTLITPDTQRGGPKPGDRLG
jgi:tRNA-binding protein